MPLNCATLPPSNQVSPTPTKSTVPNYKPPHCALAESEPQQLEFRILAQPPPRAPLNRTPPPPQPLYPTPGKSPPCNYEPPCLCSPKPNPSSSVSVFGPPPSHTTQLCTPTISNWVCTPSRFPPPYYKPPHYAFTETKPRQLGLFLFLFFNNFLKCLTENYLHTYSCTLLPAPPPTFLHHIPFSLHPLHDPLPLTPIFTF